MVFLLLVLSSVVYGQPFKHSDFYARQTTQSERLLRRQNLYKYTLLPLLQQVPDTTNEDRYQTATWSISQYMLKNDTVKQLIDTLFNHYTDLQIGTRRSLMEVVYGLYPSEYITQVQNLWPAENDDHLLAMMVYYLKRNNPLLIDEKIAEKRLMENKPHYDTSALLQTLTASFLPSFQKGTPPALSSLFAHQQQLGCKVIYSLQRKDRNYPGMAIIQNADGRFVKDSVTGRLKTFVQLARSAADLPYFITNGSTPQGAYRIDSIAVSHNSVIGPTPNIQLRLPYEVAADSFFIQVSQPITNDTDFLEAYKQLFPGNWQTDAMMESYNAGKCGRGAIIAHGTTLDPWYFRQQPFYPCTPTLGCLCAKEIWNPYTGRLLQSDQLEMVNAFLSTPGSDGYLFVINMDDKKGAITPEEVMALVNAYESKK